jgi:DNA-directed RNA polymerase
MYQQDVLSTFRTELLPQLSQDSARKLPLIPPKGKLNLEAIKQSTFFFA